MNKSDCALQITLALIEKGYFNFPNKTPEENGKEAAKLYNAVFDELRTDDRR